MMLWSCGKLVSLTTPSCNRRMGRMSSVYQCICHYQNLVRSNQSRRRLWARAVLNPYGVKMIGKVYACATKVKEAAACLGYEGQPTRLETQVASAVPHGPSSHGRGKQLLLLRPLFYTHKLSPLTIIMPRRFLCACTPTKLSSDWSLLILVMVQILVHGLYLTLMWRMWPMWD